MLVGLTAVVTVLVAARVLGKERLYFAVDEARIVAAALEPGRGGDLSVPFKRLRYRCERLVAVGALDVGGRLRATYPNRTAHRSALNAALSLLVSDGEAVYNATRAASLTLRDPASGESMQAVAVALPHNGSTSPMAQRLVILLRRSPRVTGAWYVAGALIAPMACIGLIGFTSLRTWFDHAFAKPLRRMASAVSDPYNAPIQTKSVASGRWRETAQIAEQFESLMRNVAESHAQQRRVERESERLLQEYETGFKRELRRARDQATTDALTQLKNRAFLNDQLEPMFAAAQAKNSDLSAVMLDVDFFKQYNDAHGHPVGDALLAFIGALLRGTIRPSDSAIRYAGDEFLLLLPDTNAAAAELVAERTVKLFRQYATRLGDKVAVSLSAGVASVVKHGCADGKALIAAADSALYVAKRGGKNTVAAYRAA